MLVQTDEPISFTLANFEGPLAFLLHLVQKSEIAVIDISLQELTEQFMGRLKEVAGPDVDRGAEFVATLASLIWLKSKMLLPPDEQPTLEDFEQEQSPFSILPELVEYCRIKERAFEMREKEIAQCGLYTRGRDPFFEVTRKKSTGLERLPIEELAKAFLRALARAAHAEGSIEEEEWRVRDKIELLRELLTLQHPILFGELFSPHRSKLEMIVTFLAILELMKLGEIMVVVEVGEWRFVPHKTEEVEHGNDA